MGLGVYSGVGLGILFSGSVEMGIFPKALGSSFRTPLSHVAEQPRSRVSDCSCVMAGAMRPARASQISWKVLTARQPPHEG